jgi:hypothetical protein
MLFFPFEISFLRMTFAKFPSAGAGISRHSLTGGSNSAENASNTYYHEIADIPLHHDANVLEMKITRKYVRHDLKNQ